MKRSLIRFSAFLLLLVGLLALSSTQVLGQNPYPVPISPDGQTFSTNTITFKWAPDSREASTTVWYNLWYGVAGSGSFEQYWVSSAQVAKDAGNNVVTRPVSGNGYMVWSIRSYVNNVYTGFLTKYFGINFMPNGLTTDAGSANSRGDGLYSWNYDPRATWYQVLVGIPASASASGTFEPKIDQWYEVNGDDNLLKCFTGDVCSVRPKTLPNGTYVWSVKAWGPTARLSPFSASQQFAINLAAPQASNFDPGGFYEFVIFNFNDGDWPVFVFNDIPGASWYHLVVFQGGTTYLSQWFRRSTLTCNDEGGVIKCQAYPASKVFKNDTYQWFVGAWGPGGRSVGGLNYGSTPGYSGLRTFDVANPSIANVVPVTIGPKGTTLGEHSAIFQWQAVKGATWWRLLIQKHNGTGWVTVFDKWRHFINTGACPGNVCSWPNPLFLSNGTYRWWVNAWGPSREKTQWPGESSFNVNGP
jgi:hypothetical protein